MDINGKQKKVDPSLLTYLDSKARLYSSDDMDWTAALNTIIFNEMSDDKKSCLYNCVKSVNQSSSEGEISIVTFKNVMTKTKLIASVDSNKNLFPGFLYSKTGTMEDTKAKAKSFFEKSFGVFNRICPEEWKKKRKDGGYLRSSNGITALIFFFNEALHIQFRNGQDPICYTSAEQLFSSIKRYIEEVAIDFKNMSPEQIKVYKDRQGAPGQDKCMCEMMLTVNHKYPNFTNEKLKKYIENTDAKYSEIINRELPELENEIIDRVKSILRQSKTWKNDYRELASKLFNRQLDAGNSDTKPLEEYVNLDVAYDFILQAKSGPGKYFEITSPKGERSHESRTYWVAKFKEYRSKLDSKDKIMKGEAESFTEIKGQLLKRMRSAGDDEEFDQ